MRFETKSFKLEVSLADILAVLQILAKIFGLNLR